MPNCSDNSYLSDVCLLLRCHGEQLYLSSQVLPVLNELERPGAVPDGQLGAALAYLELLWIDASRRAAETEAALATLLRGQERQLHAQACRYHAAVHAQRQAIARRVAARLTARPRCAGSSAGREHAAS